MSYSALTPEQLDERERIAKRISKLADRIEQSAEKVDAHGGVTAFKEKHIWWTVELLRRAANLIRYPKRATARRAMKSCIEWRLTPYASPDRAKGELANTRPLPICGRLRRRAR